MSARSGLFGIEALARKPDLTVRRVRRPRGFAQRHVTNARIRAVIEGREAAKRERDPRDAA
jgi:hypothetical protein